MWVLFLLGLWGFVLHRRFFLLYIVGFLGIHGGVRSLAVGDASSSKSMSLDEGKETSAVFENENVGFRCCRWSTQETHE